MQPYFNYTVTYILQTYTVPTENNDIDQILVIISQMFQSPPAVENGIARPLLTFLLI